MHRGPAGENFNTIILPRGQGVVRGEQPPGRLTGPIEGAPQSGHIKETRVLKIDQPVYSVIAFSRHALFQTIHRDFAIGRKQTGEQMVAFQDSKILFENLRRPEREGIGHQTGRCGARYDFRLEPGRFLQVRIARREDPFAFRKIRRVPGEHFFHGLLGQLQQGGIQLGLFGQHHLLQAFVHVRILRTRRRENPNEVLNDTRMTRNRVVGIVNGEKRFPHFHTVFFAQREKCFYAVQGENVLQHRQERIRRTIIFLATVRREVAQFLKGGEIGFVIRGKKLFDRRVLQDDPGDLSFHFLAQVALVDFQIDPRRKIVQFFDDPRMRGDAFEIRVQKREHGRDVPRGFALDGFFQIIIKQ